MPTQSNNLDQDEVRRILQAIIQGAKATLAMQIIERETTAEALKSLNNQEGFEHYSETLRMYDNEILFQQAKLSAVEARLAGLD